MRRWREVSEGGLGSCPICGSSLLGDSEKGEVFCSACGFVVEDHKEDRGPEWKAIDLEEKGKRVRVGSPETFSLHDLGLTTQIGDGRRDFHGKSLSPYMRMTVGRMQKWQARIRTSSEERSLSNVLSKISEISDTLRLPKMVEETAAHTYRVLAKRKVGKSKSVIGMAGASVYLACRECGVGRSLKEIATVCGANKRVVAKHYRLILREIEREYVPPVALNRYISKLVNVIKIDPKVERLAFYLLTKMADSDIFDGRAPAGLAAAFVYISSALLGERTPQREIAEAAEVTEVTVRNRSREILNSFLIRQRLKMRERNNEGYR